MTAKKAYLYASNVIKGRWLEGESIIMQDAGYSNAYARDVIEGRWPEVESMISTDAAVASDYAKEVIKGRWPEAEEAISKNARYAYFYAKGVIKGRFPKAEKAIFDSVYKKFYLEDCFPDKIVVTKDEVDEIEWSRLGLQGYFADVEWFKPRSISLLDMMTQ